MKSDPRNTLAGEGLGARLRSNLTLLPLDEEWILFSEEAQCLVGLNASAALVVRELQKGIPITEVAQSIAREGNTPVEEAGRWISATIDALTSRGMISNVPLPAQVALSSTVYQQFGNIALMPPYAAIRTGIERCYRLLETTVMARFSHSAQVRLVDAVLGHLTVDPHGAASVLIDLQSSVLPNGHLRSDIYRDGQPVGYALRLSQVGPIVKALVWQSAVNAHDFLFYIHAGVVGRRDRCILLPAAAGSGKSSLTGALVHNGYSYFSDEIALIEPSTFRVPPVPLALSIKSTGWELMTRYYPDIATLPIHVRNDRKRLRYVPPPVGAASQSAVPVSHIVFPRYVKDAATQMEQVSRSIALSRLMDQCLALHRRLDLETVEKLVRWIAGVKCYALEFSRLDEAVEIIGKSTAH